MWRPEATFRYPPYLFSRVCHWIQSHNWLDWLACEPQKLPVSPIHRATDVYDHAFFFSFLNGGAGDLNSGPSPSQIFHKELPWCLSQALKSESFSFLPRELGSSLLTLSPGLLMQQGHEALSLSSRFQVMFAADLESILLRTHPHHAILF